MESEESPTHFARWISLGDIITLAASLAIFAYGYGSLSRDVDALRVDVQQLVSRDITPGARSALSAMTARDQAQDEQIGDIRTELRDQRREMIERLARIEQALTDHDRGR